jgi:small-conductance mechanosensitive channel
MRFPTRVQVQPKILFLLLVAAVIAVLAVRRGPGQTQQTEPLDGQLILRHLNQVIDWYGNAKSKVEFTGLPSDTIYQSNVQALAAKAAQLAFQSAKAEAALIPASQTSPGAVPAGVSSRQNTERLLSEANARIAAIQSQIGDLNDRMGKASRAQLKGLAAQKDQLQGELDLRNAMRVTLEQVIRADSLNGNSRTEGLAGATGQLERSYPELSGAQPQAAKAAYAQQIVQNSRGLIGEVVAVYDQLESMHEINQLAEETDQVRETAEALHTPLQATLRATLQQGQQMANASGQAAPGGAGTSAPQPVATRQQFDALTQKFKQLADAALPLTQELALLDQIHSDLMEWRDSIRSESQRALRSIVLRVAGIAISIAIVLLLSEIWRRVTFRYISDIRRRRQFLMVRRIVIAFAMGVVLILGFVSEFSSLATFAGFITAGLAVGLQTILLSVAAYFFLVGRWGIRVGDRISVAGVTGDVVDVGLVRLYLMELAGTGVDLYPTGRVVVFANSVLFQATTPLFKQIPGTEYAWHEVTVGLNPSGNLKPAEERLLAAVRSVYEDYSKDFARQHDDVERRIEIHLQVPEPHAQLQFTDAGLEYTIRYPVGLARVAEVDARVTRDLLQLIENDGDLKATISGHPTIRAAIRN